MKRTKPKMARSWVRTDMRAVYSGNANLVYTPSAFWTCLNWWRNCK